LFKSGELATLLFGVKEHQDEIAPVIHRWQRSAEDLHLNLVLGIALLRQDPEAPPEVNPIQIVEYPVYEVMSILVHVHDPVLGGTREPPFIPMHKFSEPSDDWFAIPGEEGLDLIRTAIVSNPLSELIDRC
jgi:hypothetical protein